MDNETIPTTKIILHKIIRHKPKKYECVICKKRYCYIKSAIKHRKKKGKENHIKFRMLDTIGEISYD